ncbi:hypothetical protein Sros01_68000 [Streptomyces roseochromogenus]|nr:hypothetical protein Sros01_68000 [Streptomyces roseochromogenus]
MIRATTQRKKTALAVLAAALLGTVAPAALPATAEAATTGRVCLFLDEEGAPFAGATYGHVAWAVRDPKNTQRWVWGATENREGDMATLPGHDNGSWTRSGTWNQLRESLKPDGRHRKGYYDAYRCINTASSNLSAAERTYKNMKSNGYQLFLNNCLTKSIAIFRQYSPALGTTRLPSGASMPPKDYVRFTLEDARGWEKVHQYTPIKK